MAAAHRLLLSLALSLLSSSLARAPASARLPTPLPAPLSPGPSPPPPRRARARARALDPPSLPPHPRLVFSEADVAVLLSQLAGDAGAARLYGVLEAHAAGIANGSVPSGGISDASYSLGLLHRVECARRGAARGACDTPWGAAGVAQLLRAAAAADPCGDCRGNCSAMTFVTVRDMGLCSALNAEGLAIGFDWLYEAMTDDERARVARAIQDQVLDVYSQGISAAFVHSYWYQSLDNFNTAINSGAILAALAVADTQVTPNTTAFAVDTYELALVSLQRSTAHAFLEDGGHPEGPTYNTFGLQHLLPAIDALRSATGGVPITIPAAGGRALLDVVGPANLYFNWADTAGCTSPTAGCGLADGYEYGYVLFWFARNLADAALGYVAVARAALVTSPVHGTPGHYEPISARMLMSWPTVVGTQADLDALPPSRLMNSTRLAFLRAGWAEPVAGGASGRGSTFAAVKGCDNTLQQIVKATTHTHADCGSFILDVGGARFVTDLGAGPYMNVDPPFFSLHKWDAVFYASSTAGHNTLSFGSESQDACAAWSADGAPASSDDPACAGEFVAFAANATSGDGLALLDLTRVYSGSSGGAGVRRGVALRSAAGGAAPAGQLSDWLAVADEFAGAAGAGVRWAAHTFALPSVGVSEGATLRAQLAAVGKDGGAPVLVDVVVDASACPSALLTAEPVPNATAPGLSRLVVQSASAACAALRVVFGQAPVPDSAPASVAPLDAWSTAGAWR